VSLRPSAAVAFSLLSSLALLVGAGCRPDTSCPEDGAPCGGDPSGSWTVVDACRDPFFAQPTPPTYQSQPVELARQPSPVMTSSDWCAAILLGGAGSTAPLTLPHDTLGVAGGTLSYTSDGAGQLTGSYQAVIDTTGPGSIDLSAACLTRLGASLTCDLVAAALGDLAAVMLPKPGQPCSDSPAEPIACQYYFSYSDIQCTDDGHAGCHCTYTVSFAGSLNGRWAIDGNVLSHADASKKLPTQADYCINGDQMALWGHDRTSILDQPGIRTLQLRRTP